LDGYAPRLFTFDTVISGKIEMKIHIFCTNVFMNLMLWDLRRFLQQKTGTNQQRKADIRKFRTAKEEIGWGTESQPKKEKQITRKTDKSWRQAETGKEVMSRVKKIIQTSLRR